MSDEEAAGFGIWISRVAHEEMCRYLFAFVNQGLLTLDIPHGDKCVIDLQEMWRKFLVKQYCDEKNAATADEYGRTELDPYDGLPL